MVRAILDERKTQTRRVVNPQPEQPRFHPCLATDDEGVDLYLAGRGLAKQIPSKYGKPGDRLWVRETFCLENTYEYHGEHDIPTDGRPIKKHDDHPVGFPGAHWIIPHYRATEPEPHIVPYDLPESAPEYDDRTRWKPSIFMPRWASRITLEITDVRVERLQDISEADAEAEGCDREANQTYGGWPENYTIGYYKLWQSINAKRGYGWETNPWVWVITFFKIPPNAPR